MYSKEELKNLKLEFWESFAAFCEVQPYLRGRKKIWTLYDTKVKGVELKFDANRQGAYVIPYLCSKRRIGFASASALGRFFHVYG